MCPVEFRMHHWYVWIDSVFWLKKKTNKQQSAYETLATSDLRLGPYFKWKIWNENIFVYMLVVNLTKFLFFALLLLLLRSIFAAWNSWMSDVERYEIEIPLFLLVCILYYFYLLFGYMPVMNLLNTQYYSNHIIRTVDSVRFIFV